MVGNFYLADRCTTLQVPSASISVFLHACLRLCSFYVRWLFHLSQINGQDVSQASHETVVNIIRQSGDLVAMTVVSAVAGDAGSQANYRQCATLPSKLSKKGKCLSVFAQRSG